MPVRADLQEVPYGLDPQQTGDLFLPAKVTPETPFVLNIHGGGWSALSRKDAEGISTFLADRGCAVYSIDYRLAGKENPWPACGDDCLKAADFVLRGGFAAQGLKPSRIWIIGASAGGHLALWTGLNLDAERVAGIISISGIADPVPDAKVRPRRYARLFGGREPTASDLDSMSIMKLVRRNGPRILLTHAKEDTVVPIESAANFCSAYKAFGNGDIAFFRYSAQDEANTGGHAIWRKDFPVRKRLLKCIEDAIAGFMEIQNPSVETVCPKATDEAMINPDMGFVYYKYSNRLWAYGINTPENDTLDWFPGCSTVYMRVLWNDIEPEEGVFRWDIFDTAAQNWIAKGKKIAFRIICCNQTENATPQFVRDAGAKGFWFEYANKALPGGKMPPRWGPAYDDPVFLAKLENFVKAFARRYDGDPNIAFVDVGSFGLYGEGHVGRVGYSHLEEPLEKPEFRAEFVRLAKIHLDLWKRLMPNTYLVVSDDIDGGWCADEDGELMRYCRAKGIGFRDDSIFCFPPPGTNKDCPFEYWAHDGWARKFAPTMPVVLETGHFVSACGTPKWDDDAYVRCVEAYQASYMSIHDFPEDHLKLCREQIDCINRILGYRFELRKVTYPAEVKIGEKVEIESTWVNVGVAPKTKSAALAWSLLNPDGSVAWCVTDNSFDFKTLEPKLKGVEKPRKVSTQCRFGYSKRIPEPDNCLVWARAAGRKFPDTFAPLKPGVYTLAVSVGSWQGTPEIALPLDSQIGATRRYEVGKISINEGGWEVADVSLSDADKAEIDARLNYAIGGVSQIGKAR